VSHAGYSSAGQWFWFIHNSIDPQRVQQNIIGYTISPMRSIAIIIQQGQNKHKGIENKYQRDK